MTRWEAATEIVKSFNSKGSPGYAFAALCIMLIVPLLGILVLSLTGADVAPKIIHYFRF